jgi:hypothetical protein
MTRQQFIFTFCKTPPRLSSLLRLGPCHLKSNPVLPVVLPGRRRRPLLSLDVVAVPRCPSTPPSYDPSWRAGSLCCLVFLGQWGGEELPISPSSSPAVVAVRSLEEGRAPLPLGIPGPVGRRGSPDRLLHLSHLSRTSSSSGRRDDLQDQLICFRLQAAVAGDLQLLG